ncbi:MAG: hypothetical protein EAZ07_02210 [Cytophagales bacterium]|nr:MAG: hypothetical protein EAZ07_02210 [Cytophagales bacterium]
MKLSLTPTVIKIIFLVATSSISLLGQETKIKFFGQPGFEYFYHPKLNTGAPYFRSGPLVLFVTSQLNEKFSVSGEFHAHYMAKTGAEAEIERFYIKYDHSDYLSFRFGKMYTPIGHWNLNYNFGLILQPTITRPFMLQPTHDGGFINTRDVGLQIEGNNISKLRIYYKIFIFNGIGKNGGYLGVPYQLGETPGISAQLGIEPTDGLRISTSAMYQMIQKGLPNQFDQIFNENINTYLLSGSISFLNEEKKFELISEIFHNANQYQSIGTKNFFGSFIYMGYKATDKVVPYLYSEYLKFNYSDPYFQDINVYTGQNYVNSLKSSLGLRYKYSNNVVVKFEGETLNQDNYGFSFGVKTQVAFVF